MMTVPSSAPTTPFREPSFAGGRLVSTTGRALPLLGSTLSADAAGGIARVTLEQRFKNPYAEPLAVTYSLPLPHDGAVSGFAFRIGARRVIGEIDRKKAARERYEQALVEGRSAALLEQDRSSLFTQEIGNIPPGEEVVVEVSVDQRLRWLDEGAWEWRFPTVVSPKYLGEPGRVPDADRVTQDVADGPLGARVALSCNIRDALTQGRRPESPSHAVEALTAGGTLRVELRDNAGARLDRDLVLRWCVATPKVGLSLDTGRAQRGASAQHAHALLTIVPPSLDGGRRAVPRDLIVLLDTSGSMHGEPLAQAVRVTSALVETLRADDRLEMIEFSSAARRWKAAPVAATETARREALAWLASLQASGSTEMRAGILEALATVRRDAQRQVVLITDGQIGFESQVVAAICDRLPLSSRLHTVGVGSAVNRSLTGPSARAGHGVEVIVGLGEDAERAASRIVARTNAPLLVDLELRGSALHEHAPAKLPDLFAGAPALVSVALKPEGGELMVRGRTPEGTWEQRVRVPAIAEGHGNRAVVALFGREAVEDLETRLAAGGEAREIDASIERIGIDFQISTRLTSWVAISEDRTVDPSDPLRRERMPHELPYGVSAEGLGLRPAAPMAAAMPASAGYAGARSITASAPAAPMKLGKMMATRVPAPPPGLSPGIPMPAFGRPAPKPTAAAEEEKMAAQRTIEPEEAPVKARRSRGLFGMVRDLFVSSQEAHEEPRRLRGRIALKKDNQLVIEVFAELAELAWAPSGVARITLADGQVVVAKIDTTGTTHAGTVAAGAMARLALEVWPSLVSGDVRSIALELDGATVTIEV
jgi:Ca-activated chloride channel family protein